MEERTFIVCRSNWFDDFFFFTKRKSVADFKGILWGLEVGGDKKFPALAHPFALNLTFLLVMLQTNSWMCESVSNTACHDLRCVCASDYNQRTIKTKHL